MAKIFTPCDSYVVISKCSHWLKSRHDSSSFPIRAIAASRVISAYSGKFMVLVGCARDGTRRGWLGGDSVTSHGQGNGRSDWAFKVIKKAFGFFVSDFFKRLLGCNSVAY